MVVDSYGAIIISQYIIMVDFPKTGHIIITSVPALPLLPALPPELYNLISYTTS